MGAWGCGLYDNDTAMDCSDEYEGYLKKGYSVEQAINKLKQSWFVKDNWSILVIADLQIKNFKKIDDDLKSLSLKAIQEELNLVKEWRNPKKRESVINEFYNSIKTFVIGKDYF